MKSTKRRKRNQPWNPKKESLYNAERPQRFDEIVGNTETVITITTGVVRANAVPGYIFTGPFGSGKTSLARLVAFAVSCTGRDPEDPNPCGNCLSCGDGFGLPVNLEGRTMYQLNAAKLTMEKMNGYLQERFYANGTPAVIFIDEFQRASVKLHDLLLTAVDEEIPFVLMVSTPDMSVVEASLRQRLTVVKMAKPPHAETLAYLQEVNVRRELGLSDAIVLDIARRGESLRDCLMQMQAAFMRLPSQPKAA